jgi:hypothetical protein
MLQGVLQIVQDEADFGHVALKLTFAKVIVERFQYGFFLRNNGFLQSAEMLDAKLNVLRLARLEKTPLLFHKPTSGFCGNIVENRCGERSHDDLL